ncbi:MAG: FadR/GntR family transcriptional regulator [Anaerolineae bacterium]
MLQQQPSSSMMYRPINKGGLTEQVATFIQDLILAGDLQPGDRLPSQRDLASQLAVSPAVVREAVRVLQERRLIEARAGSGTYVLELGPDSISESLTLLFRQGIVTFQQLHVVRRVLEIEVAALAARASTPADLALMTECIRNMDAQLDCPTAYCQADADFHLALARSTQNPIFPLLSIALLGALQQSRYVNSGVPGAPLRGQSHHRRIYDCVARGDVEEARHAMDEHLSQVEDDYQQGMALASHASLLTR